MKLIILSIISLLVFSAIAFPQNQDEEKKYDMKTYYMVFLKKGENRSQDSATAVGIQKAHLDNINRLAEMGKIIVAGPFLDDGDVRGIFIMDVTDKKEAEDLVNTDPAVIAGRLGYEIRPWMTAKGTCFK